MDDGKIIYTKIIDALKKNGQKRLEMCSTLGISSQNITNIKNNRIPAIDSAIRIADYLHVPVKWLFLGEDDEGFSPEISAIASKIAKLPSKDREEIMLLVEYKLGNTQEAAKKGKALEISTTDLSLAEKATG